MNVLVCKYNQGLSLVDSVMVKQARQHAHKPLNALGQL